MSRNNKLTLSALLIVFALPPLTAYTFYFSGLFPTGGSNKGYLIQPVIQLPSAPQAITKSNAAIFNGRWNMVMLLPDSCNRECKKNIYLMRQVQIALGKDANQLRRILLLESYPIKPDFNNFLKDFPNIQLHSLEPSMTNHFKQAVNDIYLRVFIVDPWGNLMMYHPQALQPKDLLSDLKRLILVNRNHNRE